MGRSWFCHNYLNNQFPALKLTLRLFMETLMERHETANSCVVTQGPTGEVIAVFPDKD